MNKQILYILYKRLLNLIIYIPGFYWVQTRLYSFKLIITIFIFNQLIPFSLIYAYILDNNITAKNLFIIIFTFLIFISFYEIGYICNDLKSSVKEIDPTLRKSNLRLKDIRKFIIIHIISGILFLIIFFTLIKLFNFFIFNLVLFYILLIFLIHNIINVKYRLFTMILLYFGKFNILYLGIIQFNNLNILHLNILLFNLISAIIAGAYYYEHKFKKDKFIITNLIKILYFLPILVFVNYLNINFFVILFTMYIICNFFTHNYRNKYTLNFIKFYE